ncbi:unnamed protein product [Pylaiella littoralis]
MSKLEEEGAGFSAGGFNSGIPHSEPVAQAWFHLVFSSYVLVVGTFIIFKMFRARNVLEIRARSAYLVMTLGLCLLAELAIDVHVECRHLFGWPSNVLLTHLIFFFTIFTIESCYIWRVVRLGVSFHPGIKRAIPWVMSEKLAVISSVLIGGMATIIPGYYYAVTSGSDSLVPFVLADLEVVWKSQIALISVQVLLLPVVWMVDDVFRISWELVIFVMLGFFEIVVIRLSQTNLLPSGIKDFLNSSIIGLLRSAALFGLSVVNPMRRLWFNPMSRPIGASRKVHARSSKDRIFRTMNCAVIDDSGSGTDLSLRSLSSRRNSGDFSDSRQGGDVEAMTPSALRTRWSYDNMASVPAVQDAFRAFASRALCQESIMFLDEVAKYEEGDYSIARPDMSQFAAFNHIVKQFVNHGALDEINIGCLDKNHLVSIFKDGSNSFFELDDDERRQVFRKAYVEIRSMLEINLLHRFFNTEGFRNSLSADTEHVPANGAEP